MEDNLKCLSKESHRMLKLGEIHKRAFNLLRFYIKGTESQASPHDGIKPAFPRSTAYKTQPRLTAGKAGLTTGGLENLAGKQPASRALGGAAMGRWEDQVMAASLTLLPLFALKKSRVQWFLTCEIGTP